MYSLCSRCSELILEDFLWAWDLRFRFPCQHALTPLKCRHARCWLYASCMRLLPTVWPAFHCSSELASSVLAKSVAHQRMLYLVGRHAYCMFVAYQWPWNRILLVSMTSPPNMTAFFPWPVHPRHADSCIFSLCVKLKDLWEGEVGGEEEGWHRCVLCAVCAFCAVMFVHAFIS